MKVNWLRKVFDAITAGETPADVDAAAHRSALWTAFITCLVLYTISFVLNAALGILSSTSLAYLLDNADSLPFRIFAFISSALRYGTPPIIHAFFIPFFIYAFILMYRRLQIPIGILTLASAVLFSNLIFQLYSSWRFHDAIEITLLVLTLGMLRLVGTMRRWKLLISSLVILLLTYAANYGFMEFTSSLMFSGDTSEGLDSAYITVSIFLHYVLTLIRLPVLIILPIGLMASLQPFVLPARLSKRIQPAKLAKTLIVSSIVLASAYGVLKSCIAALELEIDLQRYISFLDTPDWSMFVVLLALSTTALLTLRASKEFTTFLLLVPIAMITSRFVFMLSWLPDSTWIAFGFLIGGLAALYLASDGTPTRSKIRAALAIAAGCVLLWLWCWLVLPGVTKQVDNLLLTDTTYPFISAAIARFALLAYVPTILFAAWWFISPKEIESLVLGKPESAAT